MWPSGQVAGSSSLDFRGGQAEALNWKTWPVAGLRVLRFSGDTAGTGQERTGKQGSPGETGGVGVGGLGSLGAKRRKVSLQAHPPGRSPRSSWVVSQKHRSDLISAEKLPFVHIISRRQSVPSALDAGPLISRLADLTNVPPHPSHCPPLPAHAQCQHMPWVSCLPAFALAVLPGGLPPLPWAQPGPACPTCLTCGPSLPGVVTSAQCPTALRARCVVVPLPGVPAVYWSVPHVPFLPANMGTGTMSGTFLCSPSWRGKHKARFRYICVGHEKSSIIPIWQRRKLRPTSERNVPKVTEPSSPSGSKTNSMEWHIRLHKSTCLVPDGIQGCFSLSLI